MHQGMLNQIRKYKKYLGDALHLVNVEALHLVKALHLVEALNLVGALHLD